jgi:hypothetical protein
MELTHTPTPEDPMTTATAPTTPAFEFPLDPMTGARLSRFATNCLICGLPLCDAVSVQVGVGPTCRKRIGLDKKGPNRDAVNALTAAAALYADEGKVQEVLDIVVKIEALGYDKVAAGVYKRFIDIRIEPQADGSWLVKTPFSHDWNAINWDLRLGRWDAARKGRVVNPNRAADLKFALGKVFAGRFGLGADKQVFAITAA